MNSQSDQTRTTDRRFLKNNRAIKDAYEQLALRQDPARITVTKICETADVNRSTFYQHYGYMERLEAEVIDDHVHMICAQDTSYPGDPGEENRLSEEDLRRSIRSYIRNLMNDELLLALINSDKSNIYVNMIIESQCRLTSPDTDNLKDQYSFFFQNSGACSTIIYWYRNGRQVPLQVLEGIIFDHLRITYDQFIR